MRLECLARCFSDSAFFLNVAREDFSMSGRGKKISALFLNLVAPGVGHFAIRANFRGKLYLILSALCVFWALARVGGVFVRQYVSPPIGLNAWERVLHSAKNIGVAFGWPMLALMVLWAVSYIDLFAASVPEEEDGAGGGVDGSDSGGGV